MAAILTLASIYDVQKLYEESEPLYQQALKLDANNAITLNNYAYSLTIRNERLEDALIMVKQAIDQDSLNGAYWDTYGWIYYQMGDYQNALKYVKKSASIREPSAEVLDHLGDIYAKQGDSVNARLYWQKSLDEDPLNEKIQSKLGVEEF